MLDDSARFTPEGVTRLKKYVESELLRGVALGEVKRALAQAGWPPKIANNTVDEVARNPQGTINQPLDLKPILVFQENGELKLDNTLVNSLNRSMLSPTPAPKAESYARPKPKPVQELFSLSIAQRIKFIQILSVSALISLLLFHVHILSIRYLK